MVALDGVRAGAQRWRHVVPELVPLGHLNGVGRPDT